MVYLSHLIELYFPLQITWFVGNAMSVRGTLFTTNWTAPTLSSHRASGSTVWRRGQQVCSLSNQGLVETTQFSSISFLQSLKTWVFLTNTQSRFATSIQRHSCLIYITPSIPVEIVQTWMRGARQPEPCARTLRDPSTPWRRLTRHSANSWTSARKQSWTKR